MDIGRRHLLPSAGSESSLSDVLDLGDPATVIGAVIPVIVDPIKFQVVRVTIVMRPVPEDLVVVPGGVDADTSTAVPLVVARGRDETASPHPLPDSVEPSFAGVSMRAIRVRCTFAVETPARRRVSASHAMGNGPDVFAALAVEPLMDALASVRARAEFVVISRSQASVRTGEKDGLPSLKIGH